MGLGGLSKCWRAISFRGSANSLSFFFSLYLSAGQRPVRNRDLRRTLRPVTSDVRRVRLRSTGLRLHPNLIDSEQAVVHPIRVLSAPNSLIFPGGKKAHTDFIQDYFVWVFSYPKSKIQRRLSCSPEVKKHLPWIKRSAVPSRLSPIYLDIRHYTKSNYCHLYYCTTY